MLVTKYVSETPGINGGYPVIDGTRTPVWCVLDLYAEHGDIRKVVETLPHLTPEQVQGALDYYAAFPDRVDEDLARNAEAWEELTGTPWSG